MASVTTTLPAAHAPDRVHGALRRATIALAVGAAAAIALAVINQFVPTTTGDGSFRHAGDYWLTGDGIPYMLALLLLLPTLSVLQGQRRSLLGRAGTAVTSVGALALVAVLAHSLAVGNGSSLGPVYVLASLATLVGVALFAAGSWQAGLLPRWLLVLWVTGWAIGGALPIPGPGPLLLAAAYIAMAITLTRHRRQPASS